PSAVWLTFDPNSSNWYVTFQTPVGNNPCGPIRYVLPDLFFSPCNPNTFTLDSGGNTCAQVPPTVTVTPLSNRLGTGCCTGCDTPLNQATPRRLYLTITNPSIPSCYDPIINVPIPIDIRDGQGCFQCDCFRWQVDPNNLVRIGGGLYLHASVSCGLGRCSLRPGCRGFCPSFAICSTPRLSDCFGTTHCNADSNNNVADPGCTRSPLLVR